MNPFLEALTLHGKAKTDNRACAPSCLVCVVGAVATRGARGVDALESIAHSLERIATVMEHERA